MCQPIIRLGLVAALAMASAPAHAGDLGLNAGVTAVEAAPQVAPVDSYPYVAASWMVSCGPLTLAPSLGVEVSPVSGRWGGVAVLVADVPLSPSVGLDGLVTLVHDQEGARWDGAAFFAGGGAGLTWFLGAWSVSASVALVRGVTVDGWWVVPGVNVGYVP